MSRFHNLTWSKPCSTLADEYLESIAYDKNGEEIGYLTKPCPVQQPETRRYSQWEVRCYSCGDIELSGHEDIEEARILAAIHYQECYQSFWKRYVTKIFTWIKSGLRFASPVNQKQ